MSDDVPRKHQVVGEYLQREIRERLGPHDRLPTERELAEKLDVSRLTVRRALQQLTEEGLVYRIQGAGTFVAEPAIRKGDALTSFSEDMRARGLVPSARLLVAEEVDAGARRSFRLGVSPGEPLLHLVRLRLADRVPICLEDVYLVRRLAPDLLAGGADLEGSLYELLSSRYRLTIDRAEQSVTATVLDRADAERLGVAPLSPALQVDRLTSDQKGRPVELTRSLYRGDRYSFDRTLHRG